MKKGLKITGIIIGSLLAIILAGGILVPILFKDKIREKIETEINTMVNARVAFDGYKISLFRAFPNVSFTLRELTVAGVDDFEGDTLADVKSFSLVFNLLSLFGDDGYEIKSITVDRPLVNALVLEDGKANWDIIKETPEEVPGETPDTLQQESLQVVLRKFNVNDGRIYYSDRQSDMAAEVRDLDFNLSGNMSASRSVLVMDLAAGGVDFVMDKIPYLTGGTIGFQADIDALLDSMKFTLKDNLLKINDVALNFSGTASMPGDDIDLDLAFSTPETAFKSLLSLVPAFYMKGYEELKASGTFSLEGVVKGIYSSADSTFPDITARLKAKDGVISYPDLPEKITAINIDGRVQTDGKEMDNTTVDVSRFHFELAGNPFDMTMQLATPLSDLSVAAAAKGRIDLAKLQQAIPLDSITINGLVDVSIEMAGRMSMLENKMYDQFKASGDLTISDMAMTMVDMPALKISNAGFVFNPASAELTGMAATMGEKSDFTLSGRLENYISYLFSNGTIKGNLSLKSKMVDLNEILDIIPSDTLDTDTAALEVFQIPKNIDFTFDAVVERMAYGKLSADDVKGKIIVRDGVVTLSETGMNALGGSMLVNASYDTRDTLKPLVDAKMLISAVNIRETFNTFNTVRQLVPAAAGLGGSVTVKMDFRSLLSNSMMPLINTMSGSGELTSESVQIMESKSFDIMKSVLKMNKAYTNVIKDLKATFIINDGRLFVKPFDTKLGNIKLNVSGDQGLDRTINYLIKTEIPSAELGASAAALMGALSSQLAAFGLSATPPEIIKVNLRVGGTFTDPVVTPVFAGSTGGQTGVSTVSAVTTAVTEEITQKVNDAAREQADRIMKEAGEKADMLRKEAESSAEVIREEADLKGKKLIKDAEARGPIAVVAAKKAADALNKEADKRATQLVTGANAKADSLLAEAKAKADELLK
ncbi:MAG: AsmA family protein [Bacteroidales bacterium]|nr:AsmA family protein [Bacteroidales bacterium]